MKEFLNELRVTAQQQLENADINHFVDEIEQIGQQLETSQEFLLKETQRLKYHLNINYTKLDYANELRAIDQKTLNTFKIKFQNLTQLLADVKKKEINAWHLVQFLRVNTSRLWQIFQTATGTTIGQELIYEDLQKLFNLGQTEKDERTTNLILLEKEHGDLLIKMKEIQLSLEHFRTLILQTTRNINETKLKIQNQQQINDRMHQQSLNKLNHLISNTKDIQTLLFDYKSIVNEINYLLKLIFHIQTEIEIHHKSILIYQTKLEKSKQDLTSTITNRTDYENEISNLHKTIHQQNQNFKQLENQQKQIFQNRQQLHQHIQHFETEKNQLLNNQQQLLDTIKQTTFDNNSLEKEIFQSNHAIKDLQYSYRQTIKEHSKQRDITNHLHKTIETSERRLAITKDEINQLTEQVKQQDHLINDKEIQTDFNMKELQDLDNCLSTTHEELGNQRTKVHEIKAKVKSLNQKLHKLTADEKPLAKEISHYQKQVAQNEINHNQLELSLKQNETRIQQYKTIIAKLILDSNQTDRILTQENLSLKQCLSRTKRSNANIKNLSNNLKHSEYNYQNLKEIFYYTENENKQLKQKYTGLTFIVQLLGQRQAVLNNELKPLYEKTKRLAKQHLDKVKIIEQSKSDLDILHKYYLHLKTFNNQLHQSLSFKSHQHYEYLNSQYMSHQLTNFQTQLELEMKRNSNHIHHVHTLRISSPDRFNRLSKVVFIKKRLVQKSNELSNLKNIFHEKETLYHYLNQIYIRRQKLGQKMNACDVLNDKLIRLQNKLKLDKDSFINLNSK